MSNRKFTFLDNIFWLHYGINVFHFQSRWQMIIFYMVLRQNEFSFIVKQSTQPAALFLLHAHRKLSPFIKLSWILLLHTLTVLQVTSLQGNSQDNQWWWWWRHLVLVQSSSRDEACCWQGKSLASSPHHFWGWNREGELVCILLASWRACMISKNVSKKLREGFKKKVWNFP